MAELKVLGHIYNKEPLILDNRLRDWNIQGTFKIKSGRFQWGSGNNRLCHMLRMNIFKWKFLCVVKGTALGPCETLKGSDPPKYIMIGKFL